MRENDENSEEFREREMYLIIVRLFICSRVKLGMENQQVWVRDPKEGFIVGKFMDMVDGDALIVPLDSKYPQRTCPLDEVYPAGEYTKDVEDNCKFCLEYPHTEKIVY